MTVAFSKTHDYGKGNCNPDQEKKSGNYQIAIMILHVVRSMLIFDISFDINIPPVWPEMIEFP
jgi:hypothetical protein